MPNLRKKSNNHLQITTISGILAILTVLLMAGCSLRPPNQPPTTVGPAPTLPPTTATQQETETQPPMQIPTEPPQPTATPIIQVGSLPDPAGYSWQLFLGDLRQPVFLTNAGDGSGRVFIIEKAGRIQIAQNGEKLAQPFLDISGRVNSQKSERGLLGLAFHPNYAQNGYFYVDYTDLNGNTVVSRFQVSADPNIANPDSESILLRINQPYANHNGGMLVFGPDGYLYIGTGDGGSGGDPHGNGQNPNTLLGKILRLDVDSAEPYAIPTNNAPGGAPEIWALGLRNPWRFSFDRATGDLWIGDVGQNQWEEIDMLPAGIVGGVNLGWNFYEGNHAYNGTPPGSASFVSPVLEYAHSGGNCSVTGGYVYRGQALADWQGVYLFGDYCSGTIWGTLPDASGNWQAEQLFQIPVQIASFGEDEAGELYLVDLNGAVYMLVAN